MSSVKLELGDMASSSIEHSKHSMTGSTGSNTDVFDEFFWDATFNPFNPGSSTGGGGAAGAGAGASIAIGGGGGDTGGGSP